jgi:acyl-coenzyme A thioesterase PaaI-like protein
MPAPDPQQQSFEEIVAFLNTRLQLPATNPAMTLLHGRLLQYDQGTHALTVRFIADDQLSNGANAVQGGFTAAMLDASCAFLVSSP